MDDPYHLQRFVDAQERVYAQVLDELDRGTKTSHWMWFVFPQLRALGRSATAQRYGIASLDEAKAYWRHPTLGPRLGQCTALVLAIDGKDIHAIFGSPDDLKFCSSMTLFERAAPEQAAFGAAIDRYFGGKRDAPTLALLQLPAST